jgi:hypothetical protein
MNAFTELWRAVLGWLDLLTARADAAEKFSLTRAGLVNATGFYIAVAMAVMAVEVGISGFPGWGAVLVSLGINLARLAAIWLIGWLTVRAMGGRFLAIAVPATYAMGLVLALTLPLAYIAGPNVLLVLLGVRAYLFYRAARQMAGLGFGISAAFAFLCIVALAAIPLGLYMLTSGGLATG